MLDTVQFGIERVLRVMGEGRTGPSRLDELFLLLRTAEPRQRESVEDRIWTEWCAHGEEEAVRVMQAATEALEEQKGSDASRLMNEMVDRWPDWSEAWNKRATLRFAADQHAGSLADIARTLALEPRHFGALGGFGQICLHAGDYESALVAFEAALRINPNLGSLRQAAEAIRDTAPITLQ
ncbi:MAG: tetratricopeptide repeat protein [Gammaproteobacteria bacterium]|nr:tetratricopeptide repeat protein [Gammaproteobacteria bacterium]